MFAIDCETLGVDLYHGVKPFFVTICWDNFRQEHWEFEVDPYTRKVIYNPDWVKEIEIEVKRVASWGKIYDRNSVEHCILGQNLKFDSGMLCSIDGWTTEFPWEMAHDTLIAAHILASNRPHDLTSLAKTYLGSVGAAMENLEEVLHQAVQKCRRKCRRDYKDWLIAEEGLTDDQGNQLMPSAKGGSKKSKAGDKDKVYKYDYWLPKTIAIEEDLPYPDDNCDHEWDEEEFTCHICNGHRYHTILRDYANADSAATMGIWPTMEKELKDQDLWEIYLVQIQLPHIFQKMEKKGLVLNLATLREMESEFKEESDRLEKVCVNIAKNKGYELTLPKGSRNKSLEDFVFNGLGLESEVKEGAKSMSFDKNAIATWQLTLPLRSEEKLFIDSLKEKRDRDMALSFIKSYRKFGIPLDKNHDSAIGALYLLHPSNNQTGTDTLRTSSQNPNAQQISKLEKANLRKMICFPPGREGWSLDAQNIELRIPAYKSNEEALINVFEKPKDAPYFGSYHLVIFDLLHPELFKEYGEKCKTLFESSWYQWVKNFNFCLIYGGGRKKSDLTSRVPGSYDLVRHRFPGIAKLSDAQVKKAGRDGFIETIPDKALKTKRGYPLWCSRTDDNFVLPTVPLNYYVQGSACYWTRIWMIECEKQLVKWRNQGFDSWMLLNVHDELVFDFPFSENKGNLWRIRELQKLGEKCGDRIEVPIVIGAEYHKDNWAVGEKV